MTDTPPTPQNRPLVTFALFAYNQEKYIREAVEGAFSQTYKPLEIILSDDCSSDRTYQIMQEMAAAYDGPHEVVVRRNEVNVGLSQHINIVILKCRADYVCWAAGDDISLPQRTERLVNPMIDDNSIFGSHSGAIHLSHDSKKLDIAAIPLGKQNISMDLVCKKGESVVSQSHAFRTEVFSKFGSIDLSVTNEGPVMSFRELALGSIIFVDEPLIYYRRGPGISTQDHSVDFHSRSAEATKVARWRASSFNQIYRDSLQCPERLTNENVKFIIKNMKYYNNLLLINEGESVIVPILKNLMLKTLSTESLKAAGKAIMPYWLYRMTH